MISPVAKGLTLVHAALAPPDSALPALLYSKPKGEPNPAMSYASPYSPVNGRVYRAEVPQAN